jgi:hypothetical protein
MKRGDREERHRDEVTGGGRRSETERGEADVDWSEREKGETEKGAGERGRRGERDGEGEGKRERGKSDPAKEQGSL